MRRLFVIRKDLELRPGKLGAMCGHHAEAYWLNLLRDASVQNPVKVDDAAQTFIFQVPIDQKIWAEYVLGVITKTICECKDKAALAKVEKQATELGLVLGKDFSYIRDNCLTDLVPEDPDGRTTIGIQFRPMPDDLAHKISKKLKLYGFNDQFHKKTNYETFKNYDAAKEAYDALEGNKAPFDRWLFERSPIEPKQA